MYEARPNVTIDAGPVPSRATRWCCAARRGGVERSAGLDRARAGPAPRPCRCDGRRARGAPRVGAPRRTARPVHPAWRRGAEEPPSSSPRARDLCGVRQLPCLRGRVRDLGDASGSWSTRRCSGRACATRGDAARPRRHRPEFLPAASRSARGGRGSRADEGAAAARRGRCGDGGGLARGVLRADPRGRVVDSHVAEAIEHVNTYGSGAPGGDHHRQRPGGRAFQPRRRRGLRLRQRLDALHRRRRVRDGRRDRNWTRSCTRGPIGLRDCARSSTWSRATGQARGA